MAKTKPASTKPVNQPSNPASQPAEMEQPDKPPTTLHEAKLRVMALVPYIRKRGKMQGSGNYSYVRDTDVIGMLKAPMYNHGLALAGPAEICDVVHDTLNSTPGKDGARVTFRTTAKYRFDLTFIRPDGQKETEPVWVLGEGADSYDKSSNKSMSAARKYALLMVFQISTGDDPDAFDETGTKVSGDDDDTEEDRKPQRQQRTEKPSTNGQQAAHTANALPASGEELYNRLADYDRKLAAEPNPAFVAGELLSCVTEAGVKAGHGENIRTWAGAVIEWAVNQVKEIEKAARARLVQKLQEQPKPSGESVPAPADNRPATGQPAATESKPADQPPAQPGPQPAPAQPSTQPASAKPTKPEEVYNARIERMGKANTKQTLDDFRAKYSTDQTMTKDWLEALEKCYWANVQRLDPPKKS